VAALKHQSVSPDVFLIANNETDFVVKQQTLFQNVKAIDEGEPPLSAQKKSGHPVKLMDKQWDIVAGVFMPLETALTPGTNPTRSRACALKRIVVPEGSVRAVVTSRICTAAARLTIKRCSSTKARASFIGAFACQQTVLAST
jgi:hypothetical protein